MKPDIRPDTGYQKRLFFITQTFLSLLSRKSIVRAHLTQAYKKPSLKHFIFLFQESLKFVAIYVFGELLVLIFILAHFLFVNTRI